MPVGDELDSRVQWWSFGGGWRTIVALVWLSACSTPMEPRLPTGHFALQATAGSFGRFELEGDSASWRVDVTALDSSGTVRKDLRILLIATASEAPVPPPIVVEVVRTGLPIDTLEAGRYSFTQHDRFFATLQTSLAFWGADSGSIRIDQRTDSLVMGSVDMFMTVFVPSGSSLPPVHVKGSFVAQARPGRGP
jgi:hypothetical protein